MAEMAREFWILLQYHGKTMKKGSPK